MNSLTNFTKNIACMLNTLQEENPIEVNPIEVNVANNNIHFE